MKKVLITLLFIIGLVFNANAQSKIDFNQMVGFGCGFAGEPSTIVQTVSNLIDTEDYLKIVQLLDSENNAEKFLAVVVCEKLSELNKIKITNDQKEKISSIHNSDALVSVCSGCTYWDQLTLKKMLVNNNPMRVSANYWIESKFTKK